MSVVALFSGTFCNEDVISQKLVKDLNLTYITENEILQQTSESFNVPIKKLVRDLYQAPAVLNEFTHEKQRHIAYIQSILAETLKRDNILYSGFSALLIPQDITHVLRVCLIADIDYRTGQGGQPAVKTITKLDNEINTWTQYLFRKIPWDTSLYDMLIPVDKISTDEIFKLISENLSKKTLQTTDKSKKAVDDFVLASKVNLAIAQKGHDVRTACIDGKIIITIEKNVVRLEKLKKELKEIAVTVSGVNDVDFTFGPHFKTGGYYSRFDFETISKVLVVDDEKDFALTLSKRLSLHEIGSSAVFSGEDALSFLHTEVPDVFVLDLKMPGIDGIEVLKTVIERHPHVKVIMLTGQGTPEDKDNAMRYGAFAYLEKPVEIELLVETMQAAYREIYREKDTHLY
ncbi:response regulator [Candidatus Magnetomonas plexicatena]|uniref:response regulator n=1 Tax=Candidatus Magnetomonas plexicatena TaxID=2552947 RepID=UPI0010FFE3AB|nr:response regulator [Nitrospirales bacterium LBB_01]